MWEIQNSRSAKPRRKRGSVLREGQVGIKQKAKVWRTVRKATSRAFGKAETCRVWKRYLWGERMRLEAC
jgi:hypothetical protein